MKNLTAPLIVTFLLSLISIDPAHALWNGKIVTPEKREVTRSEFLEELSAYEIVVIGEKHYTKEVQEEEGRIISDLVLHTHKENDFSLSWEFLNASAQKDTASLFQLVIAGKMPSSDFLLLTQGVAQATLYAPMIDVTASLGGKLFGVNLSREEKAPVSAGGLGALDPKLLPPGFKLGGQAYAERFAKTMGDHIPPEKISNYFASQSLVDDVSAYHVHGDSDASLKFLVIGAFHSMYNDGVVVRLKERNPSTPIINVEVIDASDYREAELEGLLIDPKYGPRADAIIFVNEPSAK